MKGILFNTDMVKAILDERKTQTRRPIKPQPQRFFEVNENPLYLHGVEWNIGRVYPQYQVGDILYVRETYFRDDCTPDCSGQKDENECPFSRVGDSCYGYKAQYANPDGVDIKWRPSIHMPKEASRIFLRVTDIRAERVQDITEADAMAEGIHDDYPMDKVYCPKCKGEGLLGTHDPITLGHIDIDCHYCDTAKKRFVNLWDSLYAAKGYGWDANPYVWKYTFERTEKPNE